MTPERLAAALRAGKQRVVADLYTDSRGAAWLLDVSAKTLQRWRRAQHGPEPVLVGRSWLYDLAELSALLSKKSWSPGVIQGHSGTFVKDTATQPEQNAPLKNIGGT